MPAAGRLGDTAKTSADSHSCQLCPHTAVGPAIAGSSNVTINGKAALRVGDKGVHIACCGSNTWSAKEGSAKVTINGKGAHRKDDATKHCGGDGKLTQGSSDVIIGGGSASGDDGSEPTAPTDRTHWVEMHFVDASGKPFGGRPYRLELPDGTEVKGKLGDDGRLRKDAIPGGACEVTIADVDEARWRKHLVGVDELTDLCVVAPGFDAGTEVRFQVFRLYHEHDDEVVASLSATLDEQGKASASWSHRSTPGGPEREAFLFKAQVGEVWKKSDVLVFERAIVSARWSKRNAADGEEIVLRARTSGFPPGAQVKFTVHRRNWLTGADEVVGPDPAPASIDGDRAETRWKAAWQPPGRHTGFAPYAEYCFVVDVMGSTLRSDVLAVQPGK